VESKVSTVQNINVVSLSGRLDSYTTREARKLLDESLTKSTPNIIVNMQDVTFADSTALSLLVVGLKRARELNGDLKLCCLQQNVRMIFELTRLDKVFEILPSELEAVQAFNEG
jgi:anti-sigma B factor antagonist